jgi:hypothetical protein
MFCSFRPAGRHFTRGLNANRTAALRSETIITTSPAATAAQAASPPASAIVRY